MKTNEEIVNKIREMMNEEDKKIKDLTSVLNQQEDSNETEKAARTQRRLTRHFAVWITLLDLEKFVTED